MGNYWSDYTGTDGNGNGLGDSPYSIDTDNDEHPLMVPWEIYEGKIMPSRDIAVSKLYTNSCAGTGGYTKSIEMFN
jgi:hypothetical protein